MVHRAAVSGFGSDPHNYEEGRPSYHPELVERLVRCFGSGRVLEIGAGTGILTDQLLDHGVDVVAVEPVGAMRRALAGRRPGLDLRAGTAEDLPAEANSFDTVVVAQAFHWFDAGPALEEIHRVLVGGGHLVTVWNVKVGDAAWFGRYTAIVDRHAGDTPRHADMRWRQAIDEDPRFGLVDEWEIDNGQPTDAEGIVKRALSTSFVAALPAEERAEVASQLRAALTGADRPLRFPYRGELQAWVAG